MTLKFSNNIPDLHLKSMLDVALESSQKHLTELREALEKTPEELADKEREFMFRECAKLENIGNLQVKLDEYREANSSFNAGQRAKKAKEVSSSTNSTNLGNHLRAIGEYRPNEHWQAHHIVCARHASHAVARFKLFAYFGVNDPFNGCWLPSKHKYAIGTLIPNAVGHAYLHTNKYANWIRGEIRPANSKQDLINRLCVVKLKLHNTSNLPDILTEKGKQDLRTKY